NLANTAWAFATLSISEPQLFEAIARASEQRIGDFKPQELANTAWAFVMFGISEPRLFEAIARASKQRFGDFKPQELANIAWAFAIVGVATRGALEKAVNAPELTRMGIAHANELCVPKLGYHVDIAILPITDKAEAGVPLDDKIAARAREAVRAATVTYGGPVVEVDGPSHYDAARRLFPATELIRRHLALVSCTVVAMPHWEWRALKSHAQKAAYLVELLCSLQPRASSRA
ncbi:hypothetical protein T492DRAFT_586168, partial [Pavlovales sp. CCMP2436]